MRRSRLVLVGLLFTAAVPALAAGGLDDWRAFEDSLRTMHPRARASWLSAHGIEWPGVNAPLPPQPVSDGLRLAGKWGRGPAVEVTGRDSLVFVALGSEVAIFSFADPDNPELLAEAQASGLVAQVRVRDSLLYIGCSGGQPGIEVWNMQNPRLPEFRGRVSTLLTDFCIRDTYAFVSQDLSGLNDSFKVFSTADPGNPYLLGACRDSGMSVAVTGNTVLLAHGSGVFAIDVSDPRNPHHVGSWSSNALGIDARGSICAVTRLTPDARLSILDVSDPANMRQLGVLDGAGGWDVHLSDSIAFLPGFQAVCIADSTQPRLISGLPLSDTRFGVWAECGGAKAYVADQTNGLVVVDIRNIASPAFDTAMLGTGGALDLEVRGSLCYVATDGGGLKILDVSNPATPALLGELDTLGSVETNYSVVADDSFAYMGWFNQPFFRVAVVTDPAAPRYVGSNSNVFEYAQDMVLRDTLVYCADHYQFEVVNVADPANPRVVGSCGLPERTYGMCLRESLAYVSTYPLSILSVSDPRQPRVIGAIPRGTWSVFVRDSWAYLGAVGLHVWNVVNPTQPQPVDSLTFGRMVYDVVVVDTLAYLSCSDGLRLVSVSDMHGMRVLAFHPLPYVGGRLVWHEPHVYVAARDAGICVFETTQTGLAEAGRVLSLSAGSSIAPNPVRRWLTVVARDAVHGSVALYEVTGRQLLCHTGGDRGTGSIRLDLAGLKPGLYFVGLELPGRRETHKVVKQ